ncbi:MAG: ATP-binding protein [Deltaproteobacteria bacterium]|nr:ATP-binding protein [Deltaproteobacteria bacterium]
MKTKSFTPEIKSVHQIQEFIKENLSISGDNEKWLFRIDLVIEEIVVNIINHGCKGIKNGIINIMIDNSNDNIILEISDNGVAFNPLEKEEPDITSDLNERKPGGLGIFLVKQIAKKIEYTRKNNKNTIRLFMDL